MRGSPFAACLAIAALSSVEPQTGYVRALVGGTDWNESKVNLALGKLGGGSGRQAGSSFKPFTLADFIESGYSIDSTFQGPPAVMVTSRQCQNLDGSNWTVNNFKNETFGDLDVRPAGFAVWQPGKHIRLHRRMR